MLRRRKFFIFENQHQLPVARTSNMRKFCAVHDLWVTTNTMTANQALERDPRLEPGAVHDPARFGTPARVVTPANLTIILTSAINE